MSPQLISREIDVRVDANLNEPVSFRLGNLEFDIAEITEAWPDHGYGSNTGRKKWWQRHHRYYYRVKTTDGDLYEIYYDYKVRRKQTENIRWYASKKL